MISTGELKLVGLSFLLTSSVPVFAESTKQDPPMVISMAWSSPDTKYLRLHAEEMDTQPFTGTILYASWPRPDAGGVLMSTDTDSLSWAVFKGTRFTDEMLRPAIEDLRETKLTNHKDNFLEVISFLGKGHFNWYDDKRWATVLHNIEAISRVAHKGGLRGILLDCEEYGCPFWSYGGDRPDYALKQFEEYQGKPAKEVAEHVRQRGQTFARALNKGFPGCLVWTLYAYSHVSMPDNVTDISDAGNGLYAAFIDGMLEGSDDETIFVDGCEGAYRFSLPGQFKELRKVVTDKALKYTRVPDLYKKKIRVGFGLYLDMYNYENSHPWYGDRPDENYMTPARLDKAIRNAIKISDGYVWVYSEYPSWWLTSPEGRFDPGVTARDDHEWIHSSYWGAVKRGINYKLLELSSPVKSCSNIALGKPVNGETGVALTDGDSDSRTPQIAHSIDYTVDLKGTFHVKTVNLDWGDFGTSGDDIQWELKALLCNGDSVTLASGECPNSEETTVSVDQANVTKLQIIAKSAKNWIAMDELSAFMD